MDYGVGAVRIGQHRRGLPVHPTRCRRTGGHDHFRDTEDPAGEGERVGTQIEQRAAGQIVAHDSVISWEVLAVIGEHRVHVPEHPLIENLGITSNLGRNKVHSASAQSSFLAAASSASVRACWAFRASGFSTREGGSTESLIIVQAQTGSGPDRFRPRQVQAQTRFRPGQSANGPVC